MFLVLQVLPLYLTGAKTLSPNYRLVLLRLPWPPLLFQFLDPPMMMMVDDD